VLLALLLPPNQALAEIMLDFTGGAAAPSALYLVFGWEFRTTVSLTIDGLGYWDEGGNGPAYAHQVGLWTGDGSSLLASTTITGASTPVPSTSTDGRWLFNDISPLLIPSGTYVLGALYQTSSTDEIRLTYSIAAGYPADLPSTYLPSQASPSYSRGRER
jgi:hypothetical protein